MKKVDILFLYETRVRELENICLIKHELERRGYSVGVMNTWNNLGIKKPPFKAKVVVTHAMYHDGIYGFVKDFCGDVPKIVNMQCEQIGVFKNDVEDNLYVLKGIAKESVNICWGERTAKRLRERSGIDDDHIAITGQVTLDFCREELRDYYLSREEIANKYNLPKDCNLNLFISSFSYVNLPEAILKSYGKENREFIDFSRNSFDGVLYWFQKIMDEYPGEAIIYRPHPAEADNERLKELCEKYKGRFFVISELSVKQWIAVSDKVYTWYSTASAEAYMFGVPVAVLRPVELSHDREVTIFENASFITTYEEFENTIKNGIVSSLDDKVMKYHYSVEPTMSYIRVADTIEKVYKDDKYLIKNPPLQAELSAVGKAKLFVHNFIGVFANLMPKSIHFLDKYRKAEKPIDEYTLKLQRNNYASEKDIEEIQAKIVSALKVK